MSAKQILSDYSINTMTFVTEDEKRCLPGCVLRRSGKFSGKSHALNYNEYRWHDIRISRSSWRPWYQWQDDDQTTANGRLKKLARVNYEAYPSRRLAQKPCKPVQLSAASLSILIHLVRLVKFTIVELHWDDSLSYSDKMVKQSVTSGHAETFWSPR